MSQPADRVLLNGEIHTLTDPDETYEAVAVRDGEIVRLGRSYDVDFLAGVETDVVDLDGRVLLPGFIDAHTHLTTVGRYLVHADLSGTDSPADAVGLLEERAADLEDGPAVDGGTGSEGTGSEGTGSEGTGSEDTDTETAWVLGYGYDESTWTEDRYLTREDLDRVSTERPVAAFREDMHVAAVNGVVLDGSRTRSRPSRTRPFRPTSPAS